MSPSAEVYYDDEDDDEIPESIEEAIDLLLPALEDKVNAVP